MARRRSRPVRLPPGTTACCFCGFAEDDEVQFGKLWNHDGIVTHYYCLLLSSNMEQNGEDEEGILGFLPADIQKELRRGKRLSCTYCKRAGATLGCCSSRCKRVFHLPCGLRAGSLHQFFGEFRSYCITHRIKQDIDEHIKQEAAAAGNVTCYICYEEVNPQNTIRTLWAPCCRKNAWFHRKCVQRLALSAGYFFKCPLCNNKEEFQKAMLEHGIFIPNQDASWELVPNAYQELLHRHNRCDAVECFCPKGRSHTGVNVKWELVLCRLCGSQGVHRACGHLKFSTSSWDCSECVGMLRKTTAGVLPHTDRLRELTNEVSEDESSSSSDISVGRNPSPLPVIEHRDLSSPIPSPVKLRPGPRSFKLQQAAKSAELKNAENSKIPMSISKKPEISLSSNSETHKDSLSNERSNGEASQSKTSLVEKNSLSMQSIALKMKNSILGESAALPETAETNLIETRRRVAEVIVIESDDEIEIINVKPKQNILTTKDGTKIAIHSLSEVAAEPHKAEGDVRVVDRANSQLFKSLSGQSGGLVTISSTLLPTSSISNTHDPISTPTVIPRLPKSPEKKIGNKEDSGLFVVRDVQQKNSVMNLKITNVTSLREEDFINTIQEPNVIRKINVANNSYVEGSRNDLSLRSDQLAQRTQAMDPIHGKLKSRTTAFQLSTAAIKDLNAKRKSEEYAVANSSNSANKEVTENHKRARISESKNSGLSQKNTITSWNINSNSTNGAIPMLAISMPITCSSNSYRFKQTTTTLQSKPNAVQTDNDDCVKIIYSPDNQERNHNHPSGMGLPPGSVQNKTNNTMTTVNVSKNELFSIGLGGRYMQVSKVTKTYSSIRPQIANQPPIKTTKDTDIRSTTQSNQQVEVDGSQNSSKIHSRFFKPQTSTQQVPTSSKNSASVSHSVSRSRENVTREIQSFNDSRRTLQPNSSPPSLVFFNSSSRIRAETPTTSSNGNPPSNNNVTKKNHSITQLANGISIASGCDGDAGSSPAPEAGSTNEATSRSSHHGVQSGSTGPITFTDADPTADARQKADNDSSVSISASDNPTCEQRYSSPKTTRECCDRPRLIPKNVPLQNLKFHILDPKIIQIVVCDTLALNINANTGDLQNIPEREHLTSSIEEQEPLSSLKQDIISSSKFGDTGNCDNNNTYTENGLPKPQNCSEIADTPKKVCNPLGLKFRFNNSDTSSNAATVENNKTEASLPVLEKRCKISETCMIEASLAGDESYSCIRKLDSIKNIHKSDESLICTCFEGNNTNPLCIQHKENLPAEEVDSSSLFGNDNRNLKNLSERDNNIIFNYKRRGFSENIKQTLVERVEHKNSVRSMSSIDFYNKTNNLSNNKDERIRSIGLNRVSKCLVRRFDESSKLKLSIDCYNNSKKIVDRSSELECNIKNLDANTQDLSRENDSSNITANLGIVSGKTNVSVNSDAAESQKGFDTIKSNPSKVPIVIRNSMSNTSHAIFGSESIKIDVSVRKSMNTAVVKDQNNSLIKENASRSCQSDLGIKVRINLDKIQPFIDCQQLIDKCRRRKSRCVHKRGSEGLPILGTSNNFDNKKTNNRSYPSKTRRTKNSQDTENSPARKRVKYHSELFEEHSNS